MLRRDQIIYSGWFLILQLHLMAFTYFQCWKQTCDINNWKLDFWHKNWSNIGAYDAFFQKKVKKVQVIVVIVVVPRAKGACRKGLINYFKALLRWRHWYLCYDFVVAGICSLIYNWTMLVLYYIAQDFRCTDVLKYSQTQL
jgi:hypothetical protein